MGKPRDAPGAGIIVKGYYMNMEGRCIYYLKVKSREVLKRSIPDGCGRCPPERIENLSWRNLEHTRGREARATIPRITAPAESSFCFANLHGEAGNWPLYNGKLSGNRTRAIEGDQHRN